MTCQKDIKRMEKVWYVCNVLSIVVRDGRSGQTFRSRCGDSKQLLLKCCEHSDHVRPRGE